MEPDVSVSAAHTVSLQKVFEVASSPVIVTLALRTSLLVGSLLNLINQGDALFGEGRLSLFKLGLTYLVPYCVATYSATSITLRKAAADPNR